MFDRLKKVFVNQKSNDGRAALADGSLATLTNSANTLPTDAVSEWAEIQGFSYTGLADGSSFSLTGMVGNKPCKLERAVSSRDYIVGEELRARAEIKVNDKVSVLIMNRALKESLEKRAYEVYTDTLETEVRPNLMEEMRWLAMYPEAGWKSLPDAFWSRYAVMADRRDDAMSWVSQDLAELLMSWPQPAPDAGVPFILMLVRGKAHLRMQYTPADMPTLEHAMLIFTSACEAAVAAFSVDNQINR